VECLCRCAPRLRPWGWSTMHAEAMPTVKMPERKRHKLILKAKFESNSSYFSFKR